ncbi:MAG: hypothetical protein LBN26_09520 [Christensenellaceae bacterium]|jgi:predicted hydrolase (HD superfamily)|nr:hypothetical protein [Christensenellaceae bacterium]
MAQLTLARAQELLHKHVTEQHLLTHALAVSAAMGAMAGHFGADAEHWRAVGYLHDVDFEKFPEEHCKHVRELLSGEDVDEADILAIISHGYGICTQEAEPTTPLMKSLFAVDELTGIIMANALMRPTGIIDMEVKSAKKKFKDKGFAAKCDRALIQSGCDALGMDLGDVIGLVIEGMQQEAVGLCLTGSPA